MTPNPSDPFNPITYSNLKSSMKNTVYKKNRLMMSKLNIEKPN